MESDAHIGLVIGACALALVFLCVLTFIFPVWLFAAAGIVWYQFTRKKGNTG